MAGMVTKIAGAELEDMTAIQPVHEALGNGRNQGPRAALVVEQIRFLL
jgi:hypothetical protein